MDQHLKRPYERPVLASGSVFGAEAMAGTCCRTSCTNAARDALRISRDVNKVRNTTVS